MQGSRYSTGNSLRKRSRPRSLNQAVIRGNQRLYQRSIPSENIFLSWLNDTGLHTLLLKVKRLGVTERYAHKLSAIIAD